MNADSNKNQLFITVSNELCGRVKQYYNRLKKATEFSREKMNKAQFDEFINKMEKIEKIEKLEKENATSELIKNNNSIPKSFLLLKDDHFPLFITYKQFTEMLMETYGIDIQKLNRLLTVNDWYDNEKCENNISNKSFLLNTSKSHFIDYDYFRDEYWPRFSDWHRNKLEPGLVYSEFSVIKVHIYLQYALFSYKCFLFKKIYHNKN